MGAHPEDEPVGQRWGKVESALWRRRRSHPPTPPRCLGTARYGRTVRDLRRTDRVSGWHRSKRTYKRKRNGERSLVSSRTAAKYHKRGESRATAQVAIRVGWGRRPAKIPDTTEAGEPTRGTPWREASTGTGERWTGMCLG